MKGGDTLNAKEKMLRVRLTEEEQARLEAAASDAGYQSVSEYVRYMTIGDGKDIKGDLEEIKRIVKKLDDKK